MKAGETINSWWGGLPARHRWILLGVAVGLVALLLMWANFYGASPAYVTLFSGLDARDAAEIVDQLERAGADYRLEQAASRILVAEREVHRWRLALASQGLPRGGVVGFELMDSPPLGATDFDRRVSYHRALQGELTRTILQIAGVEAARVHLAIPQPSLFIADRREPTAVVMVQLRSSATLDAVQVKGIKHLIAHSVEGMQVGSVTIIDASGRLLAGHEPGAASGVNLAWIDAQQAFEREMEQRLRNLLELVLGHGNVACQVTAELNFDQTTIARTFFEPSTGESGLVRSVHRLEEAFSGTSGAGEVPGTPTNIPTYPVGGTGPGQSSYQRTESTENYEINAIFEETVVAPGAVRRLSVAVVVNQELNASQQAAITQTVAAAIGFSEGRQDHITVHGIPFDTTLADQMKEHLEAEEQWREEQAVQERRRQWLTAGTVAMTSLILLVVMGLSRRRSRSVPVSSSPLTETPTVAPMDFSSVNQERVQGGVIRLARQDPSTVAQLLKSWLAEEGR